MTNQLSRRGFLGRTLLATSAGALGPTLPRLASAQSATGAGWQIGCYTRPWDKFDYRVAFDAIADEMRVTTDPDKLKELALQAHEIIGQDVPMVGIYLTPIFSVMDKGLTGVTVRGDLIQSFRNATYTG